MTILMLLLSICVAAEAPPDVHVYRHALRTLGAGGAVSAGDLPSHYVVARKFNEGVAHLTPDPWFAATSGWSLEFGGAIQQRLRLPKWRIHDVLILDVRGQRRVLLELKHRLNPAGRRRFKLVELKFEGPSRLTTQVNRVTLVPLRFDLELLNLGHHAYRRPVLGPTWARTKVFEVDNEMSPENLLHLMVPDDERRLSLVPADDVGFARLHRFLVTNKIAPESVAPAPAPAPGCARHLRLVR